jgi:hypothetical protein
MDRGVADKHQGSHDHSKPTTCNEDERCAEHFDRPSRQCIADREQGERPQRIDARDPPQFVVWDPLLQEADPGQVPYFERRPVDDSGDSKHDEWNRQPEDGQREPCHMSGMSLLLLSVRLQDAHPFQVKACPNIPCFSEVSAERNCCSRFHMP